MGSYRQTIWAAVATALASFSLYPIFTGSAWFWAGAGVTVTVALAGTLTRMRRLPVAACLAGGLAGVLLYLNLIFAHAQSLLLVIPTPSSLAHLWHLAGQGISQSAEYAPPVPELTGMVLLATGGVGLAALLADLISVRLHSAALAGLPLLLLFTEPFTLSVNRGWLGTTTVFCLVTAGYLTMLSAEGRERIREWERPRPGQGPTPPGGKEPDTRPLTAAGRRVGVASAIVALCVPLFVPGLHFTRLFGSGPPGIGGTGGSGSGIVGFPALQTELGNELRESAASPVLTYDTSASAPGYLQVYVLGDLTTSGWQPFTQRMVLSPASARLPAAPGLTDTAAVSLVTTDVTINKDVAQDSLAALPVPYPAVLVHAPGSVQADPSSLMVFDNGAQLAGLSYTVISKDVAPSEQALTAAPAPPADITSRYLEVPASYDALRGLAQSIAAGAKTPYAEAVALQNWFADGNFDYSLNAPAIAGEAGLANFLDATRTGYCQQFSFAMAVLARLLGIPSQVVYGFTQGTHAAGTRWTVTTHDAHAWPELYFQGFGWLRFEPTPGGPTGQGSATAPAYTRLRSGSSGPTSITAVPTPSASSGATGAGATQSAANRNRFLVGGADGGQSPVTPAPGGPSPWALAGLSLLALLALIVIVPCCVRVVIRHRRWRTGARGGDAGLARAAWLELRDDLTDYGAGYNQSETPRALAARVAPDAAGADAEAALRRVTMAAERARYSARPADGATLRQDNAAIRRAIAASASRRARWQARVLPPSVVAPVAIAVGQATDAFGLLNLSRIRYRGKLQPRGRITGRPS
jgi:transglutaminase-like putative cysteine protease